MVAHCQLVTVLEELKYLDFASRDFASHRCCALDSSEGVAIADIAVRLEALGFQDLVPQVSVSDHPRFRNTVFGLEYHLHSVSGGLPNSHVLLSTCLLTWCIWLFR